VPLYDSGHIGSDQASFDITSGLGGYDELRLVLYGRGTGSGGSRNVLLRFNNDSGGNYDSDWFSFYGGTGAGAESIGGTSAYVGDVPAASATADRFGVVEVKIPAYENTVGTKYGTSDAGWSQSTATNGTLRQVVGFGWRSTAAINRITLTPASGDFKTGSRLVIYGVDAGATGGGGGGAGVDVSDDDTPETASPRGRLNFKPGFGTYWDLTDDAGDDEVEVVVNLPDPSGAADGDVLTLDAGTTDAIWATPAGGGGGGGWDEVYNNAMTSLTGFTATAGATWTAPGGYVLLTGAASTWNALRLDATRFPMVAIFTCEFYLDTSGTAHGDQRFGFKADSGGAGAGGLYFGVKCASNTPASNGSVYGERWQQVGFAGQAYNWAADTWHKLQWVRGGYGAGLFLNGVCIGAIHIDGEGYSDFIAFTSYQMKVRVRNFTVHIPTLP
jgi:hypothetical protein